MDEIYHKKYLKYKNKYLYLVCNQMGGGLTTYAFFMYIMENHLLINDPFYLCCVSSFMQVRTPNNKLITIIGNKIRDKCTKYNGCIQVSVYVSTLIYAHKNTHVLIDSQIDSKNIIEMAKKVNRLTNIHIVNTSDMFSSMLNNTYDHVIILSRRMEGPSPPICLTVPGATWSRPELSPRMYIMNITDSIKHMEQLCSFKEMNGNICITSSYVI